MANSKNPFPTFEEFVAGIKRRAAHMRKVKLMKTPRRSLIPTEPEPSDATLKEIELEQIESQL